MSRFVLVAGLILMAGCGSSSTEQDAAAQETGKPEPRNESVGELGAKPVPSNHAAVAETPPDLAGPCFVQGTERLRNGRLRAVGTEPFWGARIEGRCVTYNHPENPTGTRVWTRYTQTADGRGAWIGQLEGQSFELRTRPQPGCSDGMSDTRYPIAVDLIVDGEQRQGCAEPQ